MVWTRDRIHDATGFDNGDLFRSAEEVRRYFTVANITEMFGSCLYTQDELNEMADEVIAHRWHMVLPVEEYQTVYTDVFGVQLEAIQLPWSVVRSILGREHRGTAEDDAVLIERLLESGAPEWVRTAEGWADEHGWGLISPEGTRFQSEMDESVFAEALGFDTFEDLMAASESVVREGDIDWYVTALPDGRWAAWDDAELALDRVAYFATREEAIEFHRDAYVCTLVLDNFLTERNGREAVRLPWDVVENLLGGYDDAEEDDEKLISFLREMPTASEWPKWLDNPATRVVTDDAGCWFVGPRVETAKIKGGHEHEHDQNG